MSEIVRVIIIGGVYVPKEIYYFKNIQDFDKFVKNNNAYPYWKMNVEEWKNMIKNSIINTNPQKSYNGVPCVYIYENGKYTSCSVDYCFQ